jgi:predicted nucleic acid-binding protein
LRIPRLQAIAFLKSLRNSPEVEVLHIDSNLDATAWKLLEARPDKTWSLVDCSSFAIMQQQNISVALTSDHHFEQAGFVRLLK